MATATAKKAPAKKTAQKLTAPAAKKPAAKTNTTEPAGVNGVSQGEAYANLADAAQRAEWMDRGSVFDLVDKFVAERNNAEMSQADMAKLLGMKQPALSLIENHKQPPTIGVLQRYARHLGMKLELTLTR
jgi:DNA-binding XRE family transcriptional regulator